jgi:hypothetical protein
MYKHSNFSKKTHIFADFYNINFYIWYRFYLVHNLIAVYYYSVIYKTYIFMLAYEH